MPGLQVCQVAALPVASTVYMSSKQLLRVNEIPVDVSTKLKQHDVITCKVSIPLSVICLCRLSLTDMILL